MHLIALIVIGALVGAFLMQGIEGAVIGAFLGYLTADLNRLTRQVRELQNKLDDFTSRARPASTPSPPLRTQAPAEAAAPPPAPAAPAPEPPDVTVPPVAPSLPRPPSRPAARAGSDDAFGRAVSRASGFLFGGNTVARIGVVILFFGVAFLLKYAAEHARLPIELRLTGVALGAMVLLFVGARLRRKRPAYGLTLEGGAIGVLALTIFAAFRLYHLLPAGVAFALLLATFAACAILALTQSSLALAVLGISGGFLAPVLASTGAGSHIALFSYYTLLNAAVVAIAWFRAWRLLNLIGFGFTFVIGASWGFRYYQPEFFATTEPFLIVFFLLYLAVAVLFARRQPPDPRSPVDGTIVFGVPIVGFLLQATLVKDYEYGLAWSALALGASYLGLAWWTLRRGIAKLLAEAFVALGAIFATLTLPLALDGHWTAAAWAIEGAGILWVGLRQSRTSAQVFGLLVQLGAGIVFLSETKAPSGIAILNSAYVGALLVTGAGLLSGYLLQRYAASSTKIQGKLLANVLLVWGLLWWYLGGTVEIARHVATDYRTAAWAAFIAATGLAQYGASRHYTWPALGRAALVNLVFLYLALLARTSPLEHPFGGGGLVAWPLAIAAYYFLLKRVDAGSQSLRNAVHTGAFWLVVALIGWEVHWAVSEGLPRGDWAAAAIGLVLAVALWLPLELQQRAWPVKEHTQAYLYIGAVPIVVLALGWLIAEGLAAPGNPAPLPYAPLLNPLDLVALLLLIALYAWGFASRPYTGLATETLVLALGAAAFAWLNAALFRALHHYGDIPYTLAGLFRSVVAQSAISIFWTLLAFALMLVAVHTRVRNLWVAGGGLLAVVVVKLFLVDLSAIGAMARIVSFVGVGLLLLVIGYLVPVPPKSASEAQS